MMSAQLLKYLNFTDGSYVGVEVLQAVEINILTDHMISVPLCWQECHKAMIRSVYQELSRYGSNLSWQCI